MKGFLIFLTIACSLFLQTTSNMASLLHVNYTFKHHFPYFPLYKPELTKKKKKKFTLDHRKPRERMLWLPNERAWKHTLSPSNLNVGSQSSIEQDLMKIKHIYYDKVHKKNPVFAERVHLRKKVSRDSKQHRKSSLVHKLQNRLHRHRHFHVFNRKKPAKKHHPHQTHKSKKLKHRKLHKKQQKKHKKKHKRKRKLQVNVSRKKKKNKRNLVGGPPSAKPNVAVDDTRVQIRTFTRLKKQTPIINNALPTGTKIIQPRIRLPFNHITNKPPK